MGELTRLASMSNESAVWTVKARRFGRVHIVRYWEVCAPTGEVVDTFDNRPMAQALTDFRNAREGR